MLRESPSSIRLWKQNWNKVFFFFHWIAHFSIGRFSIDLLSNEISFGGPLLRADKEIWSNLIFFCMATFYLKKKSNNTTEGVVSKITNSTLIRVFTESWNTWVLKSLDIWKLVLIKSWYFMKSPQKVLIFNKDKNYQLFKYILSKT